MFFLFRARARVCVVSSSSKSFVDYESVAVAVEQSQKKAEGKNERREFLYPVCAIHEPSPRFNKRKAKKTKKRH